MRIDAIKGALLGLVQGLAEFLPVSSSGHLVLVQRLFGLSEGALSFDLALHLATALALAWTLRRELLFMAAHPFSRLTLLVALSALPTAAIGLALKDPVEALFASGRSLGLEFVFTGLVLLAAEALQARRKATRSLEEAGWLDAVLVGAAQGVAVLPAVSRSGLTLAAGLARGLDRPAAVRFSFLASVPPILGAFLLDLKDLLETGRGAAGMAGATGAAGLGADGAAGALGAVLGGTPALSLAAGMAAAAVSGYLALRLMLKVFSKSSLRGFAWYVIGLGSLVLCEQVFSGRIFGRLF